MLHRQLRNALEEIFGAVFVEQALGQTERAQAVIYQRQEDFKKTVLGFQRLNYRDEHQRYVTDLEDDLAIALICALLDGDTNALISELGLSYI
jgi:hypothetical protein